MNTLKYTLIGDGGSDKTLMNVIKWLLNDLYPKLSVEGHFADFKTIKNPPKKGDVLDQVQYAIKYYPFDLVFYHRDAETNSSDIIEKRKKEILQSVQGVIELNRIVCVVPIIMMESWLLFDQLAIKKAAENKQYANEIELPAMREIEGVRYPKKFLHELLKKVSCKKKRNLKLFNVHRAVHLVAENIHDFTPIRNLSSFKVFEEDLKISVNYIIDRL